MCDAPATISDSSSESNLFLQIVEHLDGTITRPLVPLSPPTQTSTNPSQVLSKDLPLNPYHNTILRLYLPPNTHKKLPVILFFHGGGFVLFSPSTAFYHASCESMASSVPALVISASYRLSPENRLPAAYDDATESLSWVQAQALNPASADPWLNDFADFSRFFLMGSSSGGNIAYHAGLRTKSMDLLPLKLGGVILNQPYFGGVERTESESASESDFMLPLRANDMLWKLSLPKGADRDHEFCNTAMAGASRLAGMVKCLVKGCKGDPLVDRQRVFAEMLEKAGVKVIKKLDGVGFHAIELFVPEKAVELFKEVRDFIYDCESVTNVA